MKRRMIIISLCIPALLIALTLSACSSEKDALQTRVNELESENNELKDTISDLQTELGQTQANLVNTRNELQTLLSELEEDDAGDAGNNGGSGNQSDTGAQSGGLAIMYRGEPNKDMSWPLNFGELSLSIRFNLSDLEDDEEIVWRSTNEDVFTVTPGDDGLTAIVKPLKVGSAELVVKIGAQETRSWVRITAP